MWRVVCEWRFEFGLYVVRLRGIRSGRRKVGLLRENSNGSCKFRISRINQDMGVWTLDMVMSLMKKRMIRGSPSGAIGGIPCNLHLAFYCRELCNKL